MAIRSEEVNYLIYRYLQESGFEHTAFAFAYESMVADTKVYDEYLPPGSLITFLQKALQYIELETHIRDDGSEVECNSPFSLIHAHKCSLKKKEGSSKTMQSNTSVINDAMEIESESKDFSSEKIRMLEGHTSNVITCKWSPAEDKLITGSSDSTVRLWSLQPSENSDVNPPVAGPVLSHTVKENGNNEIIDLDWSSNGEMIVSSSYAGEVELWSANGMKLTTLGHFPHPAFNVSFSPDSSRVLVTGALPSFYVYSLSPEKQVQHTLDAISLNEYIRQNQGVIEFPQSTILINSLWKNTNAITLVDNCYHIYNVDLQPNSQKPLQVFAGHEAEINSIDWTMDGSLLISGADDGVIKLWSEQRNDSVFEFLSHHARINKVLSSHDSPSMFFSCSDDRSVKVFDITSASTVASLNAHDAPVTNIAASASLLASCGLDRFVYFTDIRTQQVVRSYRSSAHVNDLAFSREGDRLALATADSQVYILDLRV